MQADKKKKKKHQTVVHRALPSWFDGGDVQGFMLDFTSQSGALCLQVERLTGSLADALHDMANDRHCLPLPLEAL